MDIEPGLRNGGDSLNLIDNQQINALVNSLIPLTEISKHNPALDILRAEFHEDFAPYLEKLGLADDRRIIALSSIHHFYYDEEEMKNVQTVVNLKELNRTKHIKSFISSLFHSLPPSGNFIGCFVDNKKSNAFVLRNNLPMPGARHNSEAVENGIISGRPLVNRLYSFMDFKTYNNLSRLSVSLLLDGCGFKVLDMTDLNGLTYFHSRKISYINN